MPAAVAEPLISRKASKTNSNSRLAESSRIFALIAPAHSYRASVYISAANRRQIPLVFFTDGDPSVVQQDVHGVRLDFADPEKAAFEIASYLRDFSVSAVFGSDDKVVEIAAQASHKLKIPHNSLKAVQATRRKDAARDLLKDTELNVPKYIKVDCNIDVGQLPNIRYPCVAKPLNLSASRGVIRANNSEQLIAALGRIRKILQREFGNQALHEVLVEEYVAGSEHALEGYLSHGKLDMICLFDKPDPLEGPYFEETYYVTPSRLKEQTQRQIQETIEKACQAYGLVFGPIHAEVRVDGEKIWILEVAARTIGGECARLFELVTNFGLEEYILNRATNRKFQSIKFRQAAGILMVPVPNSGIVRRIEGVTQAQGVKHILDVKIDIRAGSKLTTWPEGDKYPGFIFAKAKTPELVEKALRKSHSCLNIVTMPEFPIKISDSI